MGLFFSVPIVISRLPAFPTLNLVNIYGQKKKSQGLQHCVIPWVPIFTPSVYFIYNVQDFSLHLGRKIEKKHFYAIFLEAHFFSIVSEKMCH